MAHRKTIRHYHEPGQLHEFTFSCHGRKPLLQNPEWLKKLARTLDGAHIDAEFELVAFVFMPEHIHLLTNPLQPLPNFALYLARAKQPFSKEIHAILDVCQSPLLDQLMIQERPGKKCFRFWQEGPGFDRNIYSSAAVQGSIEYIHNNPVRRGLCERSTDWKWSSARYYLSTPPRRQDLDLPHIHGPPPGVLD